MLIQLVTQHPEAIGQIVRQTPTWVWGLLAGLVTLGVSQLRDRRASLARVSLMPVAMTAFSVWGTASAFGSSPLAGEIAIVWMAAAAVMFALLSAGRAQGEYDAASRTFHLPGSVVPLLLILGIFSVKYVVGVELSMAPKLTGDTQYALTVAALYGAFTGAFVGRAIRLWKLAFGPQAGRIAVA
jgi:hypothetical protein